MGSTKNENIVAWEVKGKTLCSNCVPKGEKINRVLTEVDVGPNQVVFCERCGEVLYEDIDQFSPR